MKQRGWRWALGGLLIGLMGTTGTAWADRIYLKDGTSVWGEFAEDLGVEVTIFQGGRTLRFRKEDVVKIEKKQTNLPDHQVATPPPPAPASPGSGSVIPGGSPGGSGGSSSGSSGSGGRRY